MLYKIDSQLSPGYADWGHSSSQIFSRMSVGDVLLSSCLCTEVKVAIDIAAVQTNRRNPSDAQFLAPELSC